MQLFEQVLKELEKWELRLRNAERRIDWLEKKDENPVDGLLTGSVQGGGTYGGGGSTEVKGFTEPITQEKEGRSKRGEKTMKTGFEEILGDYPDLNVPEVHQALGDWYAYRRERNLAKWQSRTLKANLEEYKDGGAANFVAVIKQSIAKSWQGLFPLTATVKPGKAQPTVMKPSKPTADDEIRDEWFKLNSRVFGYIPKWPGREQAEKEIKDLREMSRQKSKPSSKNPNGSEVLPQTLTETL